MLKLKICEDIQPFNFFDKQSPFHEGKFMKILYFDIDSLRADHLGCYGYHRQTSPNIDELSKSSSIFDNVYASDVPCLPSRTALLTGRFGIHNGVVNHGGTDAEPARE